MKKTLIAILACAAALLTSAQAQDPTKSTDDAYSMGVHYSQRGFSMLPTYSLQDVTLTSRTSIFMYMMNLTG